MLRSLHLNARWLESRLPSGARTDDFQSDHFLFICLQEPETVADSWNLPTSIPFSQIDSEKSRMIKECRKFSSIAKLVGKSFFSFSKLKKDFPNLVLNWRDNR